MIRRPPRSTQSRSSAASDVYKRQDEVGDLFRFGRDLGDEDRLGAAGHADGQRDVAGAPAHYLYQEEAVVAGRGVAEPVDRVHAEVGRGVEADGDVGAVDVVVDRRRHADHRHPVLLVQGLGAAEAAVPADNHQAIDAARPKALGGAGAAGGLVELLTARGPQDRAAALDDVGDAAHPKLLDVVVE